MNSVLSPILAIAKQNKIVVVRTARHCVGTQTKKKKNLSGILTVIPCEECLYSALNCPRPPLDLLKTLRLHGVVGHRQVGLLMTHGLHYISAIINEEPGELDS